MLSWLSFAIALLKVANNIIGWYKQHELIRQGYDQAIAEETTKILEMTSRGKKIMEQVNALSEAEVDADLRKLEPPARSG